MVLRPKNATMQIPIAEVLSESTTKTSRDKSFADDLYEERGIVTSLVSHDLLRGELPNGLYSSRRVIEVTVSAVVVLVLLSRIRISFSHSVNSSIPQCPRPEFLVEFKNRCLQVKVLMTSS